MSNVRMNRGFRSMLLEQWRQLFAALAAAALLGACATPSAVYRFELIDAQSQAHAGSIDANTRGVTVSIGDRVFSGFYVRATESVSTTSFPSYWGRRTYGPTEMNSQSVSNQARAHLRSAQGDHLSCEFLLDDGRAVGSCQSPAGQRYLFVAGQ